MLLQICLMFKCLLASYLNSIQFNSRDIWSLYRTLAHWGLLSPQQCKGPFALAEHLFLCLLAYSIFWHEFPKLLLAENNAIKWHTTLTFAETVCSVLQNWLLSGILHWLVGIMGVLFKTRFVKLLLNLLMGYFSQLNMNFSQGIYIQLKCTDLYYFNMLTRIQSRFPWYTLDKL